LLDVEADVAASLIERGLAQQSNAPVGPTPQRVSAAHATARRALDPPARLRAQYVELIVAPDAPALDWREQARAFVHTGRRVRAGRV
jgi:hypothetical protein